MILCSAYLQIVFKYIPVILHANIKIKTVNISTLVFDSLLVSFFTLYQIQLYYENLGYFEKIK